MVTLDRPREPLYELAVSANGPHRFVLSLARHLDQDLLPVAGMDEHIRSLPRAELRLELDVVTIAESPSGGLQHQADVRDGLSRTVLEHLRAEVLPVVLDEVKLARALD